MNYFSKNKKWMAYLILLTFLFTCMMPSNLGSMNSIAEAATEYTVTFHANNGTGLTEKVESVNQKVTTLSADRFSREGYTLVGWTKDSAGQGTYENGVYAPNVTYPDNNNHTATLKQNENLYAVWLPTVPEGTGTKAYFHIRMSDDNSMPFEPTQYTGGYTDGHAIEGKIYTPVGISNNPVAVQKNIAVYPSDTDIKAQIENHGGSFDPATQEIEWYVIKRAQCSIFWPCWHVDGVIKDKASNWVIYNPNGGDSNVPEGKQYTSNASVTVDFSKVPNRQGYTFLGWDTNATATDPTYKVEDSVEDTFTMPNNDVTLYAIWVPNNQTQYTVKHYLQNIDDDNYTLDTSESKYGVTDSVVDANTRVKSYAGFSYVSEKSTYSKTGTDATLITNANASNVTIAGDGSLVINLYYERSTNTAYTVEYYYQNADGTYPAEASPSVQRSGTTGAVVNVTEKDKTPQGDYYFDANNANNVLTGTIAGDGSLKLKVYFAKKQEIKITADGAEKMYDGTALTKDSYTNTALKATHHIESVTINGSQTVAGSSDNVPSAAKIVDDTGKDVTGEYKITYAKGTLEVTPKNVTITAGSDTKMYDGTPLTNSEYSYDGLVSGHVISVTVEGEQTIVGKHSNRVHSAVIKNNNGDVVTKNYNITYVPGTLEVTKRIVTLTSATDTKVYDGKALTNATVTVGGYGFAEGEGATYAVTGTQTLVGSSANTFSYTLNTGTSADNYTISKTEGILTVKDRTEKYVVEVVAKSATEEYDGTEKSVHGFETLSFILNGQKYKVEGLSASATGTNAGEYTSKVTGTAVVKDANNNDVTAQFIVKTKDGKLTITPDTDEVTVTITGNSDSKVYNTSEQSVTGFTTDVGEKTISVALAEGSKAEAKGTNVGEYPMGLTEDDFVVTSSNYSNIKVVVV
ncbi:MAG: InlB B-repeat-containing protein, partial [Peptococcaceae bacterium]|nr:InlB B-repeat-containing protein [Peptococcaceae bacterium]